MPSSAVLQQCQWWLSNRKIAEKHFGQARELMASQNSADIQSALDLLDSALKLWPQWEKALELKARALLYLRRFKDVANMLHDYIPSLKFHAYAPESPVNRENTKLLSNHVPEDKTKKLPFVKYFSVSKLKKKLTARLSKKCESEEWRYLVLGQACCHLGMMEDAMILLQSGKKAASAAFRRQSNCMREDSFCSDMVSGSESDLVSHLMGNIKSLLRRRAAALASLEAGLYTESVRHFSKIVDGRRGAPQGFIAECYMQRAIAYQGAGRLADAIADCNRTLAFNPKCVEALSARASLFEMVRCFTECLQDLEQLKMMYESLLRRQKMADPIWSRLHHSSADADLHGNLEYVKHKIMSTRQRLTSQNVVDYHMVLGLPRGCSRADVERAYLLVSLKHRPEKAAHFVDRCELVDDRNIESVREEARSSGLRLFLLIQQAYTGVLSAIVDEKIEREEEEEERFLHVSTNQQAMMESKKEDCRNQGWYQCFEQESREDSSSIASEQDQETSSCGTADESLCSSTGDDDWFGKIITGEQELCESGGRKNIGLEVFPGFNCGEFLGSSSSSQEELALMAVAACRDLANESWIATNEWNHHHHHQTHLTLHPLSVT